MVEFEAFKKQKETVKISNSLVFVSDVAKGCVLKVIIKRRNCILLALLHKSSHIVRKQADPKYVVTDLKS